MKYMPRIIGAVVGCALGVFLSLSFVAVLSGKFDWNGPFAFGIAMGALVMVLVIANAAVRFKQEHRSAYGLIQILIGCVILLSQLGTSGGSDSNHTIFVTKLLAALFFFAQGIENFKSAPRLPT
jgi:hypothetical protein